MKTDSLIDSYEINDTTDKVYKHKIIFTTVNNVQLVYYTNSTDFLNKLKKINGRFLLEYAHSEVKQKQFDFDLTNPENSNSYEKRIVRAKLPKVK
ncbi:hypothetical protein ACIQ1D_19130 [Lysinibacillus xylanilyticus]|uniref:hypothetical protein n=1 Tax=Lysinibacillus xylanilyticus TaxID=582475 RepID=UPI00381A0C8B